MNINKKFNVGFIAIIVMLGVATWILWGVPLPQNFRSIEETFGPAGAPILLFITMGIYGGIFVVIHHLKNKKL